MVATMLKQVVNLDIGPLTQDFLILSAAMLFVIFVFGSWRNGYFRRRGIPYAKHLPFVGNMWPVISGKKSFSDFIVDLYKKYSDHPVVGVFQFNTPVLFIRDPEIIKAVTVKDFNHFVDHSEIFTEKGDPLLGRTLLFLKGQQWKDMRSTVSPAFTSSKMKVIFQLLEAGGQKASDYVRDKIQVSDNNVYVTEMKDFFSRYTNDMIASVAFGIQCDSLNERDNQFYKMGRDLTTTDGINGVKFLGYLLNSKMMEFLKIQFVTGEVSTFFHSIVRDSILERRKLGITRPDMLQLLMAAKDGELKAEKDESEDLGPASRARLSKCDIAGQAINFFFAGFDTVSTLMSFMAMALARHPDIQERLQSEIDEVLNNEDRGKLTYESIQEMKYLDMVISEVLRLYAPVPFVDRVCMKDYVLPSEDPTHRHTVFKGEIAWIPIFAIHRDPEYWPNPERFDPERFSDENKSNIKPFTYMPFGLGPRICIGSRLALLETKVLMAHILSNFSFKVVKETPKDIVFTKNNFSLAMKGGFWLGIYEREDASEA